ncbi:TldD/PmbA family protein [bacterium]|nr:TldD/PmbA family protein [bacterium]
MIADKFKTLVEKTLALGKKLGADEMEAAISDRHEFSVEILNGEIDKLVDAGGRSLSFEIIIDKKTASASTSDLSWDTIESMVRSAIERASLASSDPFAGLPDTFANPEKIPDLDIYDNSIAGISAETKIDAATQVESICLANPDIGNSHGSSYFTIHGDSLLANSKGFIAQYPVSLVGNGIYLQAGEGTGLVDEGWYDRARHLEDLWSPERIAQKAMKRATRLVGGKKIKTQRVPVIFEPSMTATLLGYLARCISGDAIYQKRSFLAGMLGDAIAVKNFTIQDNPHIKRGPGSRPWDGEGSPTRPIPIVKNGYLMNYLLDTYAARKLDLTTTGHASGVSNFYLEPGERTPEEIIGSMKKGLLLTGMLGQGFNPITGDISRGAFGLWIEDGQIIHPVSEVTISGNLGEMLNNIQYIANDSEMRQSISGPTIQIAEMTISGT